MKFAEIYRHDTIKQQLVNAVNANRIAHTQLFASQPGNAGLALAIAYGQYINCTNKIDNDSCGSCSSCVKYQTLTHPDLHFVFPLTGGEKVTCDSLLPQFRKTVLANPFISISDWQLEMKEEGKLFDIYAAECRNIIRKIGLKPYESQYKVMIIWLAEHLGKEGNILLKVLEEPTPNTVIILITENVQKILPTILSRTQIYQLPNYNFEQIKSYLIQNNNSDELAQSIAFIADGNMHKAIQLTNEMDNPMFDLFRNWLLECYKGNNIELVRYSDEFSKMNKDKLKNFLTYGINILRATLLNEYSNQENKLTIAEKEFIVKLRSFVGIHNFEKIHNAINNTFYEIERYCNVKILFINLSLNLHANLNKKLVV